MKGGQRGVELAALGALATALSPDDLTASLDRAAELLVQTTGADDCEIFLCEPGGGDVLLAACCGLDGRRLSARARFARGAGYPGLVVSRGQSLLTRNLTAEQRLGASPGGEADLRTYLCVPMPGSVGAVGCIGLAWRNADADVDSALALLDRAAGVVSTGVRAGLASAHELLRAVLDANAGSSPRERRQAFLDAVLRASGAQSASMVLFSHPSEDPAVLSVGRSEVRPEEICRCAVERGRLSCRILEAGHGAALGPSRDAWPPPCRRLPTTLESPYCLPLFHGQQLQGVLLLDYGAVAPSPLTRHVVHLMAMTRESAVQLEPPIASPPSGLVTRTVPELRLRCFGKLEIQLGEEVVSIDAFARKKALTLLKILVLRRGNPVTRDALIEYLWPGADDRAGVNRLHGVVHSLRSGIEPFRADKRWLYVRNQGELYYFGTESPHWVDIYLIRRLWQVARDHERRGELRAAMARLEEAAVLYRGDLFEDEPYADWCAREREELRGIYLDVVRNLARLCADTGSAELAVAYLRRALVVDPLREDFHQTLIEILIGLGRRRDALAQYEDCLRLLRDEIGAEPLPATRRLERVIAGDGAR